MTDHREPLIISFYTSEWEYPENAKRLKLECKEFGLNYFIQERESTNDYIQNTAMKPFFIKECLTKFQRPVIWIDVDALILKKFCVTFDDADILACEYSNPHVDRDWAVAFLGFNYTQNSLDFLEEWCNYTNRGTDEAAFDIAWKQIKDTTDLKIKTLPPEFHFVKWSHKLEVPEDTIICHQLSKSEDKLRRKNNGTLE